MHNIANASNNDPREVKLFLFDGWYDGEHSGIGSMEISNIFATQDDFFYEFFYEFDIIYQEPIPM